MLGKRPYIKKQWCIDIIEHPIKIEAQEHNRYRFWGKIDELDGNILTSIIHEGYQNRNFQSKIEVIATLAR